MAGCIACRHRVLPSRCPRPPAALCVPVVPRVGWWLAYEYTCVATVVLYSTFLQACHWWGRGGGPAAPPAAGGQLRPWASSAALFATVLASLGLVPWWADLLG